MSDSVKIPDLYDSFLMELSVCGSVRTNSANAIAKIKKLVKGRMNAFLDEGSGGIYADLFSGGRVKNHLHVNVESRPPKWKARVDAKKLGDIERALGEFIGLNVRVVVTGRFFLPMEELPSTGFIRASMKETKVGNFAAKPRAMTVTIKGDKLMNELEWEVYPSGKYVRVSIDVPAVLKIDEEYLKKCKALVLRALHARVLTESSNARASLQRA